MDLKGFLKNTFRTDIFSKLKSDQILEERVKTEKEIERISDEIKLIQDKIRALMLSSKGQPNTMKMLNIQKIKAFRLESSTKQKEASILIKRLQLILLLEAMKEHHESEEKNEFIEKILKSDIEHLNEMLFDTDVRTALEEGKMDKVKEKLKRVFAKEEIPMDSESQDILKAIDDLERVDEETAARIAKEKAKEMAETPLKKKVEEEE
ncbi:MAG: hypothetical protein JSW41_00495 [Candidatus Aenigmatarchaeota archaeon]|nr:MAG: hypothetical protein JSW41_00495 [Candidatus Aenigmarchaeota archaeon]